MENEIELKIMLKAENVEALADWFTQQHVLAQATDILENTYFDTPEQFFAQQKMGLRVRNHNQKYEMTLKTKGEIVDGLHIRPEYNLPLASYQPDFKRLNSHFNLQIPQAEQIAQQLSLTFSTDFTRRKWLIGLNQSQIEVALDQGMIKNGFGEEVICELELELKSGNLNDILLLLKQMPRKDGMWFSNLSKAQRGYLVGQAVKFKQQISKVIESSSGEVLLQQLADYIRTVEQDLEILGNFNQLSGLQLNSWTDAQQYLTSKTYFEENLAKIEQRLAKN
ncbi:CYTH domain-containing protein [Actinobacillus equuli subsp. equuli]|uniref:CYTH domain-containing protein n=1 Tax=Actinobacillus equuli subsp. equuli TaxID=202947 RepID=A0A9X4JCG2_ACTEU|nr:CYTH domain-containing protein [Actinobacillus equuli]MDE8033629.1 CYTH domain-containing protein [Actinobacillus equuli subsp. equuli]